MCILLLSSLLCAQPHLMLVELKGARGTAALRHELKKSHTLVPAPKGVTTKAKLRDAARAAGAEVIVRVGASSVAVEPTAGGALFFTRFKRLDRHVIAQVVQAITQGKPQPTAIVDEPEAPLEVAEPSSGLEELEGDEEYLEPEKKVAYIAQDGRRALVATVGYAMLVRNAQTTAADGTPPAYEGVLSPGVALSLSLFPRRFRDGGGALRNLGVYGRGVLALMPTQLITTVGGPVTWALAYSVHAGATYRHIFGDTQSSVGLGVELGVIWDHVRVSSSLPFPSTTYVSPALGVLLEVPLAKKRLVWATRGAFTPVSALGAGQYEVLGMPRTTFGMHAATGLRSTIGDVFYLEALGMVSIYWQRFSGVAPATTLSNATMRDLTAGFQISVGVTL